MGKFRIGYLDEEEGAQISVRSNLKTHFEVSLIDVAEDLTPNDIVEYIRKKHLDLIIIDFILTDTGLINFNADAIIEVINNWNPYFPVLVLTSHPNDAINQIENVNIVNEKDSLFVGTTKNKEIFILKLRKIIENSRKRKDMSLHRIEELARKKIGTSLTLKEEEEYYTLSQFINNSFPDDKIFPSHFLTPESVSELHDLLDSAKKILSKLKEGA